MKLCKTKRIQLALAACALVGIPGTALASDAPPQEVKLDKSAASDLYIARRPTSPRTPKLPKILRKRLKKAEKGVIRKRNEAISLLRDFLDSSPTGSGKAEGLFKLAELLWEDSRRVYLVEMDRYDRKLEQCRLEQASCKTPPTEPRLRFSESEELYRTILKDHPSFRRMDLVLYLIGFASQEDQRYEDAMEFFGRVVKNYPQSPVYSDSWLMIGEHFFVGGKWANARTAYKEVLERPKSEGYDLALFKTAWCDWKLGDTEQAAKRFKLVLDLAAQADRNGTDRERKRRSQLRDEALDYLVLVFTEDPSIKAADVFTFLASIGGEQYSMAVVVRLAEVFFDQGEYDRSIEAYRFLIADNPSSVNAASYQRKIVDAYLQGLESSKAMAELKVLVEDYKPGSDWAKKNSQHKKIVRKSYNSTEKLIRSMAKGFHADAQALEKSQGLVDKKEYSRAVSIYRFYLKHLEKDKHAAEIRFLLAEILLFKLNEHENAGDEYLAVGKTSPVGKWHKDALEKAMFAFRKARPKNVGNRSELLPVDRKFAESTDLFATLFPASKKIVGIIYENGQLFYDYKDYDEAIKRFGLIVTKYPDHPTAGPAGDRILDALNKGEDYENIEDWARKLRKAKSFQSPKQIARLDRLIVESIGKSGEKYAAAGDYEKAARFYLRVPKEFPSHALAPQSTFNAAVLLEKAKKPEQAASTYLSVLERYPTTDLAPKAAFTAGVVYESMAYFEKAAEAYEKTAEQFPKKEKGADALFNAGILRQALGQNKLAISHYQTYAKRFRKSRKDAAEVAFRIAVVHEQAGNEGLAEKAYLSYTKTFRGGVHQVEALVFAGRAAFKLGQYPRSSKQLSAALKTFRRMSGGEAKRNKKFAAQARYYQGELLYRKYDKVSLDVPPKRLDKALATKMKLLDQASTAYLDVVEFNDASWATAALYRIGSVMEEFANSLRDAPTPDGFSEADAQLYRDALDNEVINIEEKAIDLYISGYRKAIELKVYNQYTKKLRSALGRMAASQFPPAKEARDARRLGDRTPIIPYSLEVVRSE